MTASRWLASTIYWRKSRSSAQKTSSPPPTLSSSSSFVLHLLGLIISEEELVTFFVINKVHAWASVLALSTFLHYGLICAIKFLGTLHSSSRAPPFEFSLWSSIFDTSKEIWGDVMKPPGEQWRHFWGRHRHDHYTQHVEAKVHRKCVGGRISIFWTHVENQWALIEKAASALQIKQ